jgi:hypothetical protein
VRKRREVHTLSRFALPHRGGAKACHTYRNGLTNCWPMAHERVSACSSIFWSLASHFKSLRVRILTSLDHNRSMTSCGFSYIYNLSGTTKVYLVELGFCLLHLLQLVVVSRSLHPERLRAPTIGRAGLRNLPLIDLLP